MEHASRDALLKESEPWRRTAEYYATKQIRYREGFVTNSRGMELFTTEWVPSGREPKALVFLCHGFAVDCSTFWKDTGERLAAGGYATFGIDYEGHGCSEGLRAYIPAIEPLVADCAAHFRSVRERAEYAGKPAFLFGESMGGAVALLIGGQAPPQEYRGAVLLAPMVKISDNLKPPAVVILALRLLARVLPTWKVVPVKDIMDLANQDPTKKEKMKGNPLLYKDKPRLGTARTLLNISNDLERRMHEVSMPFLLLHGAADVVTDPDVSRDLYEKAESDDKTLRLYPGMWHSLIEGELDQNIEIVYKDIFDWLDARSVTSGR